MPVSLSPPPLPFSSCTRNGNSWVSIYLFTVQLYDWLIDCCLGITTRQCCCIWLLIDCWLGITTWQCCCIWLLIDCWLGITTWQCCCIWLLIDCCLGITTCQCCCTWLLTDCCLGITTWQCCCTPGTATASIRPPPAGSSSWTTSSTQPCTPTMHSRLSGIIYSIVVICVLMQYFFSY